jgi:hypothetical protein
MMLRQFVLLLGALASVGMWDKLSRDDGVYLYFVQSYPSILPFSYCQQMPFRLASRLLRRLLLLADSPCAVLT